MLTETMAMLWHTAANRCWGCASVRRGDPMLAPPRWNCVPLIVVLLSASPLWGQSTYWNVPSGQSGDWSVAENWTAGEPVYNSAAYVDNGGTVLVTQSGETCDRLFLGGEAPGVSAESSRALSRVPYDGDGTVPSGRERAVLSPITSTLQMTAGSLAPISIFVGYNGSGSFVQSGGTVGPSTRTSNLYLGYNTGDLGTYELSGTGSMSIRSEYVGYNGTGVFVQTGGSNVCSDRLIVRGTYDLSGTGMLTSFYGAVWGTFAQTGGTYSVNHGGSIGGGLAIEDGGEYLLGGNGRLLTTNLSIAAGGTLQLSGGAIQMRSNYLGYSSFTNEGILNGADGAGVITAPTKSLLDFSRGSIVNAQSMSLSLGAQSLVILPEGFNAATAFGSYNNQGVTYVRGTTFSVPAGKTCNVQFYNSYLEVNDPVHCQGSLSVFSWFSGSEPGIWLNNGVTISGSGSLNGVQYLTVNDAISSMTGGSLNAWEEYVGRSGTGTFTQSAGTNAITTKLWLGYDSGDVGTYKLSGSGSLSVTIPSSGYSIASETIGYYGTGHFIQTGGTHVIATSSRTFQALTLCLGEKAGSVGTYYLGGSGSLTITGNGSWGASCKEYLGYSGSGSFMQTGGTHVIDSAGSQFPGTLYLGYNAGSSGSYDLRGGQLSVAREYVGYNTSATALFQQTGGTNTTSYLVIGNGGTLRLRGGTLQVNGSLVNQGVFDGGGGAGVMNVTGGIADLSLGTVVNTGAMSVNIGADTLLVVPAGFVPATDFARFNTAGLTYTRGVSFTVPAGKTVTGSVAFTDPVSCLGTMDAAGGTIDLNAGLTLPDTGSVNLGSGSLTVEDTVSRMSGGSLTLQDQHVGVSGTGTFEHTGGTSTVSGGLNLGTNSGARGDYTLSGSALLAARSEYVGISGEGAFAQTGGTNSVSSGSTSGALYLAYRPGSSGTYDLDGSGVLSAASVFVGYAGTGVFTQSGGTMTVTSELSLGRSEEANGAYYLSGSGVLSSPELSIGKYGVGTFTQSGGTNTTGAIRLGYWRPATYTLDGGLLNLQELTATSSRSAFRFSGGTLQAGGSFSTSQSITLGAGGSGAVFDTNGYAVTLSSPLSGPGGFTKIGSNILTLSAINTYTGNTTVDAGLLALAGSGSLLLDINSSGSSTSILGDGAIDLDGTLVFDMTDVVALERWNVLAVDTLTETYGDTFRVMFAMNSRSLAATEISPGVWTCDLGSLGTAVFAESTGTLSAVPEPGTLSMLAVGLLGLWAFGRPSPRGVWSRSSRWAWSPSHRLSP